MEQRLLQYEKPEKENQLSKKLGIYCHNLLNKIFKYDIACEFDSLEEYFENSLKIDNRYRDKTYTSFFDSLLFFGSSNCENEFDGKYIVLKDSSKDFSLQFTAIHQWKNDYYSVSKKSWEQIDSLKKGDRVLIASSWWDDVPYILYIRKQEDYDRNKERIIIPNFPSQLVNLHLFKNKPKKEAVLR